MPKICSLVNLALMSFKRSNVYLLICFGSVLIYAPLKNSNQRTFISRGWVDNANARNVSQYIQAIHIGYHINMKYFQ